MIGLLENSRGSRAINVHITHIDVCTDGEKILLRNLVWKPF
jgi:hypothetical protein